MFYNYCRTITFLEKRLIILHNMIIEDERDLKAPIQDIVDAPTVTTNMIVNENI